MELDSTIATFIIISISATVAAIGLMLFRRRLDLPRPVEFHEVAGQFLSGAGTMYAVLLGLIV